MMGEYAETARTVATSPAVLVVATVIGAALAGHLLTRLLRSVWSHVAGRTRVEWDDQLVEQLGGPVSSLIALQLSRLALVWVPLGAGPSGFLRECINVLTILTVIWAVFRAIDVARVVLSLRTWAVERPASRSLLALGARFAKVGALAMGLLVALSQIGVSVASLIAGLGIGGLVLALAAQKTVENLFGAISIGIDQPLREGDFVRIYDFVGTVEQIGLRSTRIRTLDRTLVTIPNGELANQRIESYTARDRIRLACTIGLEYRTTAEQVRAVIAALTRVLREHPRIWPDAVIVRFQQFAESSLDLEVMAWFQTGDFGEFQLMREEVLLGFMVEIERLGVSIAFPTRTLHVVRGDAAREERERSDQPSQPSRQSPSLSPDAGGNGDSGALRG